MGSFFFDMNRPHKVEMRMVAMAYSGELRVLMLGRQDHFCPAVLSWLEVLVGLDKPVDKAAAANKRHAMHDLKCSYFDHERPIIDGRGVRWLPICGRYKRKLFYLDFL